MVFEKIKHYIGYDEDVLFIKDKFTKPCKFVDEIDSNPKLLLLLMLHATRPDIVVIDKTSKNVNIVEISTQFDANLDKCFDSKLCKIQLSVLIS